MAFSLSAGVNVIEKDFTTIVPAVSSSVGAFAGAFAWGPVLDPQIISSENDLINVFGKPNTKNYASFFTAANFLSYTNNLIVTRVDSNAATACSEPSGSVNSVTITAQSPVYNVGYTATFNTSTNGTTATATIALTGTTVASATMSAVGIGYDGVPVVTITPSNGVVGTAAIITATVVDGIVTGLNIVGAGSGYTAVPNVVFTTNGGGLGASATAVLTDGAISGFTNLVGGSGYSPTTPVVTVTGGGGTGATFSATVSGTGTITGLVLLTPGSGYTTRPTITITGAGFNAVANQAELTNTTIATIAIVEHGSGYRATPVLTIKDSLGVVVTQPTATVNATFEGVQNLNNEQAYHTSFDNATQKVYGEWAAKWPGTLGNALTVSAADSWSYDQITPVWEYAAEFDGAPGTSEYAANVSGQHDEMHIVVVDRTGAITGSPGTILEKFAYVSKAIDAKLPDGTNNYYADVINERSKYIWWLGHPRRMKNDLLTNWGQPALERDFTVRDLEFKYNLSLGTDGLVNAEYALTSANQREAYDLYRNSEMWDVSLVLCGKMAALDAAYVIQNVAEERKDCITFCSPQKLGNPIIGDGSEAILDIVAYRNDMNLSSSYGVLDSGYKYQYDRYNDKYWWIPLNGDIAGLCARTDYTNDPWFSPGGFNRGQIKNVVKLSHNPGKTARDTLYKNGVNPVVSFPGQGVVLYGDKTLLAKPSAFDRINVRRLFIVLEKAIASASKYSLFELNDSFTRAQFKSMVEPFLRDVQGRRGIIDFRVKCDETNNTGEVIDRNEFAGDIYIKPARSINFINLSFIAARTAVSFSEIGG